MASDHDRLADSIEALASAIVGNTQEMKALRDAIDDLRTEYVHAIRNSECPYLAEAQAVRRILPSFAAPRLLQHEGRTPPAAATRPDRGCQRDSRSVPPRATGSHRGNSGPGGPGRFPARDSHRPERAQLTHSVPQVIHSLRLGTPSGPHAGRARDGVPGAGETSSTGHATPVAAA